ncbi:MAG: hypothetical protein CVT86_07855 [Alphaproteobacteria bacterium HGW-Alphaproteobacteria-8]|nr:MAG: hypothetical protein CVT86_07855 [Alphaproteobacteria bacterium HGW-Alphaproteobacteria-8]
MTRGSSGCAARWWTPSPPRSAWSAGPPRGSPRSPTTGSGSTTSTIRTASCAAKSSVCAPGATPRRDSLRRAFLSAVAIGLGNPKAALFYLAVFPGFFDVTRLGAQDALAILAVILPILIGGNLAWAAFGARAGRLLTSARRLRAVNRVSGGVLTAAGVAIAAS